MYDQVVTVANSDNATQIKIALIGALALVLSVIIPVLFATREREPHAVRRARLAEEQTIRSLRNQRNRMQQKLDWRDKYIEALEAAAWMNDIDPRTLKPPEEP